MPSNPISFRLTDNAIEALKECEDLSGLKRSAIVEVAIREYRDRLRREAGTVRGKKRKKAGEGS